MSKAANRKPLKILIVGGHPADVFDNAGGTLLHHIRQGDSVTALALTPGARVHDVVIQEEMRKKKKVPGSKEMKKLLAQRAEVKRKEIIDACGVFSIKDVRFLTYDDNVLMVKEEIIQEIARLIRDVRPEIVITHYPYDNGGIVDQHAVASQLVLYGICGAYSVEPGDRNPPHRVAQIFFMGTPSQYMRNTVLYREFNAYSDVYVDISDVIHLKMDALNKLKSQQYDGTYARKRIEATDGLVGMSVGVAYAEPFISYVPDVHYTLPISDFLRNKSTEPQRELFDRVGRLLCLEGKR